MRAWLLVIALTACKDTPPPPVPVSEPAPAATQPGVIFRDATGRTLTKADLANATGRLDWSIVGGDNVPEAAAALFDRAREAGGKGDYAKAVALFNQAHDAAPKWPYPLYELAYTYQLMDQPDQALRVYEQVVALAPRGFFTALATVDCLRREKAKEWTAGLCKRYAMVEFADFDKRTAELQAIVAVAPGITAAWKDLAYATEDDAQRLVLLDKALANKPDLETRGMVLSNKALVLERQGKRAEAIKILGELVLDPSTPLDVVEMSKLALSQMAPQ